MLYITDLLFPGSGVTLFRVIIALLMFLLIAFFIWIVFFCFRNNSLGIRKRSMHSDFSDTEEYYLIATRKKTVMQSVVFIAVINIILSTVPAVWLVFLLSHFSLNFVNKNFGMLAVYHKLITTWETNGYSSKILFFIIALIFFVSVLFSLAVHEKFLWFLQDLLMKRW